VSSWGKPPEKTVAVVTERVRGGGLVPERSRTGAVASVAIDLSQPAGVRRRDSTSATVQALILKNRAKDQRSTVANRYVLEVSIIFGWLSRRRVFVAR
jgi:hypothetical protein